MGDNVFQTLCNLPSTGRSIFEVVDTTGKVVFSDTNFKNSANYCLAVNDYWGENFSLKVK